MLHSVARGGRSAIGRRGWGHTCLSGKLLSGNRVGVNKVSAIDLTIPFTEHDHMTRFVVDLKWDDRGIVIQTTNHESDFVRSPTGFAFPKHPFLKKSSDFQ
jgi:hypothetical protein